MLIIAFLTYLLYTNKYFDHLLSKSDNLQEEKIDVKKHEEKKEEIKEKETKKEVKKPTLDELKKEYANLLDGYTVSDKCSYLGDLYKGNLTSDLKKYFTLNSFDFDSLKKEEDYQIISNDTFKLAYEKLFNTDYNAGSFDYNGNSIRYVNMINSYMTASLLKKEETLIQREILDIKLDDNKVLITTVEGIVKDNKIYNILNNREIDDYEDGSLVKNRDDLNKVVYVFKDNKLISFSK